MSDAKLMAMVHELCASMDALAAIGAELRRRRDGLPVAAPVRDLIDQVIRGVDPDLRWGEALRALKVVRNGGYPWKKEELDAMLTDRGFANISTSSLAGSTITIAQNREG